MYSGIIFSLLKATMKYISKIINLGNRLYGEVTNHNE